ncbi:hypothetical protein Pan153_12020 [Gimesia panareensis]|uniref:Response regulatory domain-containing protein n=1 Tax=Gimesia panareensis TaxID=2527978 RepID=A0A517Q5W8_9PLAN|nr:response regulator [Gimesia panareensis]QDT27012.1 hypothetical protein Enr10x_23260 [Gimesia panareensis]QDV16571.1 hypothetical protein Pan153_12020 [Gimesia panareensis]
MTKRVLSVGQCLPDASALSRFLNKHFEVQIEEADVEQDTLQKLKDTAYDLVMINRKLDADYSDGIELMQKIKNTPDVKPCTLMLVSNYVEYQEQAVGVGAAYGIGKNEYRDPETVARLQPYLG